MLAKKKASICKSYLLFLQTTASSLSGYPTIGKDLIVARHIDGEVLFIQLKSRLAIYEKYRGKDLYIAFPDGDDWFLFPHDELLRQILRHTTIKTTSSWSEKGGYSFPRLSVQMRKLLEPYRISGSAKPIEE